MTFYLINNMPDTELPYTNKEDDGRVKILPSQHTEIKLAYQELNSYRKVAELYGVTKNVIRFICNPEQLKEYNERRKKREPHLRYYNTEKRREYMRTYRAKKRKHKLLKSQQ